MLWSVQERAKFTIAVVLWILMSCALAVAAIWYDIYWMQGTLQSWVAPTPVFSLVGLFLGFGILVWQLQRQHENALEENRRQAQDRLRLDIYQEIASRLEATSPPLAILGNVPTLFIIDLKGRVRTGGQSFKQSRYSFRFFQECEQKVSDTVLGLIVQLELYEIVMPRFRIFREHLSQQLTEFQRHFNEFSLRAALFTTNEVPVPLKWPPEDSDIASLEQLGTSAQRIAYDLMGTIFDLRVEAQNYLLGALFPGNKASPRVPGDPKVPVLTVSDKN